MAGPDILALVLGHAAFSCSVCSLLPVARLGCTPRESFAEGYLQKGS